MSEKTNKILELSEKLLQDSVDFGKALQLVNIIKDFNADWNDGRCYWPLIPHSPHGTFAKPSSVKLQKSFELLHQRFLECRERAWAYLEAIDRNKRADVYKFCVFPLRMAEETIAIASKDLGWLLNDESLKVGRLKTVSILAEVGLS